MTPNKEVLETVLDDSFLKKLALVARIYGWNGDYIAVSDFVHWCCQAVGKPTPNLEVIAEEDDEMDLAEGTE